VTAAMLEELILYLANTSRLSAVRINDIRKALSVPLSEALRLGKIHHNPMVGVIRLKEEKPKREPLSLEEARRFFNLEWPDPRLRLINMLAAATGMRLGECRGLQRTDVMQDGANYEIQICHNWIDDEGLKAPKWDSVRTVPIPAKIAEALLELADSNPWENGFVFAGYSSNRAINKHEVEKSFNGAVHRIGITEEERCRRKLTFHSWRHWYVTYLRGKILDHTLQQLTRHRTEGMLDRYSHVTEEQRQAVAVLGESLF
jgi:integrase